jgi:hypothetical protein
VVSDLAIALAYYSIPPTILYMVRKHRTELPFRWVFVMFAVFIFLCGTTHVVDIITLWYPVYGLQGVIKALTAAASFATALLMFALIPTLFEYFRTVQPQPRETPAAP